jgi:hypothetical protein
METRSFILVFTRALDWSLSPADESTPYFFHIHFNIILPMLRNRVAQSVQCLTTDRTAGVRSPTETEVFPAVSASRPALGPTQPPIQWVPGALSPGVKRGWGVMLTTHPLPMPRLRKIRSYTSSHPKGLYGV